MIENPTQTPTRMLGGGGRASGETIPVVDTYYVRSEVSLHSSRAIPDWQVHDAVRRYPMQDDIYPADWKLRAAACLSRAGYRCEDCGTPHGVLRIGKKSKSPYIVYLHAAHVNHDPENPQAELRALCPSCHLKHDRRTEHPCKGTQRRARRQGYQFISATRLVLEVRSAGLHITQQGDRYLWQVGDLGGIASDVLDAVGLALHCLVMERLEEQEEVHA